MKIFYSQVIYPAVINSSFARLAVFLHFAGSIAGFADFFLLAVPLRSQIYLVGPFFNRKYTTNIGLIFHFRKFPFSPFNCLFFSLKIAQISVQYTCKCCSNRCQITPKPKRCVSLRPHVFILFLYLKILGEGTSPRPPPTSAIFGHNLYIPYLF